MTYPHGAAAGSTAPAPDPRYLECAGCGHFPNWHSEPRMWVTRGRCLAWAPNATRKCLCPGWRHRSGVSLADAKSAARDAMTIVGGWVPFEDMEKK